MTHHRGGVTDQWAEDSVQLWLQNCRRFCDGETLLNQTDRQHRY